MINLILETRLNKTAGVMSVAVGKNCIRLLCLLSSFLRATRIDIKSRPHEWGQWKLADHMNSKEEKGEIMVFLNELL